MQRAGRGCPGSRVRADPPIGLQDRPRSPWQPRGLTGGDYETGVTRLSVAAPRAATGGDVWGRNGVAFKRREGEKEKGGRPKSTVCSKRAALSICPLNHPLSAATPMCSPPGTQFVPAFLPLDWSAVNNNFEMVARGEIFNAGLKTRYFGLGCSLNHFNST